MRTANSSRWLAAVIVSVLGAGCGDDSSGAAPPAPVPEASIPEDADTTDALETGAQDVAPDGPELVDLVVTVRELFSYPNPGAEWPPLEGATVAIELPDGSRVELKTDAKGQVTVPDAGNEEDKLVIVAHKPDYAVWSWETTIAQALRVPTLLQHLAAPEQVTVSGTALGMLDPAHQLMVNSTNAYGSSQKPGADFSLPVAPGQAFSLLGLEFAGCSGSCTRCICQTFQQWTRLDHAAVTADTTVDLDFSQTLQPVTTTGTIGLPERADSRLRTSAYSYLIVSSFEDNVAHGFSVTTELSADKSSFSYDAEHVEWDGASDVQSRYLLIDQAGRAQSQRTLAGYPKDGATVTGFIDIPEILSPTSTTFGILDTFEWVPREATDGRLVLLRDGVVVWTATVASASSIRLPKPPSTVDVTELLGAEPLDAYFLLMADLDPTNKFYLRYLLMYGYKVTP